MSKFQDWCKEILIVVQAAANGEEIEYLGGVGWLKKDEDTGFRVGSEYRVKPRTIRIGEYDVPEPMREPPQAGHYAYIADPVSYPVICKIRWTGGDAAELMVLNAGLIHADHESAILHSKALISLTSMEK